MKPFDSGTLARLAAGEVDYFDAVTIVFDSAVLNLFPGAAGSFEWEDETLGAQTFTGAGPLLAIEPVGNKLGLEASPLRIRFAETYLPQGSTTPVNVFEGEDRDTVDQEPWQHREVILSVFWRAQDGSILCREQVTRRLIDAVPLEFDDAGNPIRVFVLERPEIVQRDVEGRTSNHELQQLIDPADKFYEHAGTTARRQKITLGEMPDQEVPR